TEQDRLVQRPQLVPRFDPQLLDQLPPGRAVGSESLTAAAGGCQRGHQLGLQSLVQRVGLGSVANLVENLAVLALLQAGSELRLQYRSEEHTSELQSRFDL